ncbi:MAG: S8 family serine peptidase [bacterium]
MKLFYGLFFICLLPLQLICSSFVPGQILVKFDNNLRNKIDFSFSDTELISTIPEINHILNQYEITECIQIIPNYDYNRNIDYGLDMIYLFKFNSNEDINSICQEFRNLPVVISVDLNYQRELYSQTDQFPVNPLLVPNDPLYSQQWFLPNINAEQAWDIQTGNHNKKVCIIDVGIDWDHEDLSSNWITGYDFYDNDPDPDPGVWGFIESHGTHCSGCAAGVTNNSTGIASVGSGIGLIGVRAGFLILIDDAAAIQGIYYACTTGADVISMSFGGTDFNSTMQTAINEAYNNYDIVVVAAAGNDNDSALHYPACMDNVIAVAATDNTDHKASFSCYGSWVDISAPGDSILSSIPDNAYSNMSGTSMACPVTAGLVTLIRCQFPSETNDQIIQRLLSSADSLPNEPLYLSGNLGAGKINAFRALGGQTAVELLPVDNSDIQLRCKYDHRNLPVIVFSSPEPVDVEIDIYDLSGRKIIDLVKGRFCNQHYFSFDTETPGIYTYYATINQTVFTGKVIIIK